MPKPGEVSLAHGGVLFLDEMAELQRNAAEALRQPLEEGLITIGRAKATLTFPARFALVAAVNPCPCGHLGDLRHQCTCTPPMVERYRARVSGPLLDRIDLHLEVPAVELSELTGEPGEPSAAVAGRVAAARKRQQERFGPEAEVPTNAAMSSEQVLEHCELDRAGRKLLDAAFERLGLSARAYIRILKVSRTLADLEGCSEIRAPHVAEAIQYRALDRRVE